NGIGNGELLVGDMKNVFNADFVEKYAKADLVLTDPPRDGMHRAVVGQLLHMAPERITSVSHNTATPARDLAVMKDMYRVVRVQPVDMFPQTHHVENVVLLEKAK